MTASRPVATSVVDPGDLDELYDDLYAHQLDEFFRGRLLVVVVTGSRDWTNYRLVCENLDRFTVGELHEGAARGADACARRWAISRGVTSFRHPADWKALGRSAGPRRNIEMHKTANADLVVAFKNDFGATSNGGTEHMVSLAWDTGTPVWHVDELGARWLPRP
jgi:hypothetical protein